MMIPSVNISRRFGDMNTELKIKMLETRKNLLNSRDPVANANIIKPHVAKTYKRNIPFTNELYLHFIFAITAKINPAR